MIIGSYYSVKEYHRLLEILKRLRAKKHDAEDLSVLCEAMERRLIAEEAERDYNRAYQRRYRLQKRQS